MIALLRTTAALASATLALAAVALPFSTDDDPAPNGAEPAGEAPRPTLAHVVTIGASVSAGYGNSAELTTSGDVPLSAFLRAALAAEGAERFEVSGGGDRWFFSDSTRVGKRQVDAALAEGPTLVVAVDFLFWYAYGRASRSDPRREEGLEKGLAELDRIGCPLVIGDLPNIEHALEGEGPFGGPIVHRGLFPTEAERERMNATIRAWAEERGDVAIVSLAEITETTLAGRPVVVRDRTWSISDLDDVYQSDRLHPKVRATIWIALAIADAATRLDGVEPEAFVWDEKVVRDRVWAATAASRAERADRERKRAERRAKREQRSREREERDQALLSH